MANYSETSIPAISYWRAYYDLCKPRVVLLMLLTAVVGMFLATPNMVPLSVLIFGNIGIAFAACAAAAINHVVDQKVDAMMGRTKRRPLPTGRVSTGQALIFATVLASIGMIVLWELVNSLTAVLSFATLIGYAVIYTVFLKHTTPQNIVIGGAAGAAPPLLGWVAVTGHLDPHAWLLVLIIFTWTPPHFWALAIQRKKEYELADVPMLPVTHGERFTKQCILLYTLLLFAVSLLPFVMGMSGLLYIVSAVGLGIWFVILAIRLLINDDSRLAMRMFRFSIWYLMWIFVFLLVDHYI